MLWSSIMVIFDIWTFLKFQPISLLKISFALVTVAQINVNASQNIHWFEQQLPFFA